MKSTSTHITNNYISFRFIASMGNAISGDSSSSGSVSSLDDNACLEIQNSAIFNDAFVAEVFEGLPAYPGTDIKTKKEVRTTFLSGFESDIF